MVENLKTDIDSSKHQPFFSSAFFTTLIDFFSHIRVRREIRSTAIQKETTDKSTHGTGIGEWAWDDDLDREPEYKRRNTDEIAEIAEFFSWDD